MSDKEYELLKKATIQNSKVIFFKNFSISIPYIIHTESVIEKISELPALPEFTEEETKRARLKIAEIKKDLNKRLREKSS